ncbi:MAG: hypothetical protein WC802_02100 [Patescibacteria group bacterium]|jgi:hypothetical protein
MRANVTFLFLVLSITLTGCPHVDTDTGTDSDTNETGDTADTDTADKSVTLNYTFNTDLTNAPCDVNVDGKYAGPTGTDIKVTPGPHVITFGKLANQTADHIPIHTDSSGDWVHPPMDINGADGEVIPTEAVQGNRYVFGRWFCQNRDVEDDYSTSLVTYTDGQHLNLTAFTDMNVSGEQISGTIPGLDITGEFYSSTTAVINLYDTTIQFMSVYDCHYVN